MDPTLEVEVEVLKQFKRLSANFKRPAFIFSIDVHIGVGGLSVCFAVGLFPESVSLNYFSKTPGKL